MIKQDILEEIIKDKFKILGLRFACKSKGTFLFDLKTKYGDSLDSDMASKIYDRVRDELIQKEENYNE